MLITQAAAMKWTLVAFLAPIPLAVLAVCLMASLLRHDRQLARDCRELFHAGLLIPTALAIVGGIYYDQLTMVHMVFGWWVSVASLTAGAVGEIAKESLAVGEVAEADRADRSSDATPEPWLQPRHSPGAILSDAERNGVACPVRCQASSAMTASRRLPRRTASFRVIRQE